MGKFTKCLIMKISCFVTLFRKSLVLEILFILKIILFSKFYVLSKFLFILKISFILEISLLLVDVGRLNLFNYPIFCFKFQRTWIDKKVCKEFQSYAEFKMIDFNW